MYSKDLGRNARPRPPPEHIASPTLSTMSDLQEMLDPLSAHHLAQMLLHFASKYSTIGDEIREMISQVCLEKKLSIFSLLFDDAQPTLA